MLNLSTPLVPKISQGPLRVLIISRISTEHQNIENLQASADSLLTALKAVYQGPIQHKLLGERASGMLWDRQSIREAEDDIATESWDLVLLEDLSRAYRNSKYMIGFVQHAVDHRTRLIAVGDGIDTADEGWEMHMAGSAFRHSMHIPDTRRRVKRTGEYNFRKGGMVTQTGVGYRKLTVEEAASGAYGPVGLRLCKLPEYQPIFAEIRRRVLAGDPYQSIVAWLNAEHVPLGKYSRIRTWTVRLLLAVLRNRILQGVREWGRTKSIQIYASGKYRRERNAKPDSQFYPELAFFTQAEYDELMTAMDARQVKRGPHPRKGCSRYQSYWPGQHLRCGICGNVMFWAERGHLKCQQVLPGRAGNCWNQTLISAAELRKQFLPALLSRLRAIPAAYDRFVDTAWSECQRLTSHQQRDREQRQRDVDDLQKQIKSLLKSLQLRPDSETLLAELDQTEQNMKTARTALAAAEQAERDGQLAVSREDVLARLDSILLQLAETSYEFGLLMRKTFPEFVMFPVQALDTPQIHPRVRLTIPAELNNGVIEQLELDPFVAPQQIRFARPCQELKDRHPEWTLVRIGQEFGIGKKTVSLALQYAQRMQARDSTDPYVEVTERPQNASRWRKASLQPQSTIPNPDRQAL